MGRQSGSNIIRVDTRSPAHPLTRSLAHPHPWPAWPLKALLVVLFCGPLLAPLFQATGLPFMADSGALAHDLLSRYICPTPAKSYMLIGFPMAVCARCWGATIGLWLAWGLFRPGTDLRMGDGGWRMTSRIDRACDLRSCILHPRLLGGYLALAWPLRLALAVLPFLLWTLEINAWAAAPRALLLLNGAHAGFWAGLFLYSVWPGLRFPLDKVSGKHFPLYSLRKGEFEGAAPQK